MTQFIKTLTENLFGTSMNAHLYIAGLLDIHSVYPIQR